MTTSHSSGRPVLLVHGFGSSTDSQWRQTGWVGDLEAAGRTVIGVDLPGHGASKDLTDRDAADLLLDEAAQHGSVDAVGFSAGSWALLAAASERPELFDRIAVLGAGDRILTDGMHTAAMQRPMVDALRTTEEPTDNPMVTMILAMITAAGNDRDAVADFLAADKRFPTLADLARITAATLLVEGSADPVGPSELLARTIPHAERLVLDGADHFEIPIRTECRTAVTSFLNRENR